MFALKTGLFLQYINKGAFALVEGLLAFDTACVSSDGAIAVLYRYTHTHTHIYICIYIIYTYMHTYTYMWRDDGELQRLGVAPRAVCSLLALSFYFTAVCAESRERRGRAKGEARRDDVCWSRDCQRSEGWSMAVGWVRCFIWFAVCIVLFAGVNETSQQASLISPMRFYGFYFDC